MICAVVADDLTGACDAGVRFGAGTTVYFDAARFLATRARVAVLDLATRNENVAEARRRIRETRLPAGIPLFKKIDSTLHGHVAVEIEEMLAISARARAVLAPALPEQGRIVVNGRLLTHQVPGPPLPHPRDTIVCDAATDADLDAIVAVHDLESTLWAGSSGLAGALARRLGLTRAFDRPPRASQIVFYAGSRQPVTRAQLEQLPHAEIVHVDRTHFGRDLLRAGAASVLLGGDTAEALCRAAGIHAIELRGEILPGIPWGIARGGRMSGATIVTKAGGFGAPDALVRVHEALSETIGT